MNSTEFASVIDEYLLDVSNSCDLSQVITLNGSIIPDAVTLAHQIYTGTSPAPAGTTNPAFDTYLVVLFDNNPYTYIQGIAGYMATTFCHGVTDSTVTAEFSNPSFVTSAVATFDSSFPLDLYGDYCLDNPYMAELCVGTNISDQLNWNADWTEGSLQLLTNVNNMPANLLSLWQFIFKNDESDFYSDYRVNLASEVPGFVSGEITQLDPGSQEFAELAATLFDF